MKYRKTLLAVAAAGVLNIGVAFGQAGMGMAGGMGMGANPRFDVAPEVGELFPDVTIVDDKGNPVNIRELAGNSPYTVLTLGCLT